MSPLSSDLRFRVQTSFSSAELRKLLGDWGAPTSELEADVATLAHQVVRIGGKRFGAGELLRRLKLEKPLVEWPDIPEDDPRWAGPISLPTPPPPEVAAADPTHVAPDAGEVRVAPAEAAAPAPEAAPPPPEPPSVEAPPASLRQPPSSRVGGFRLEPEPPAPRAGVDPRILYGAVAGMVLLAALAFGAGLLWRRGPSTSPPSATAEGPARGAGPAGRAADLFDASLVRVADACQIDVAGTPNNEVFQLALEACGRDEVDKLRRRRERELAERVRPQPDDEPRRPPQLLPDDDPAPSAQPSATQRPREVDPAPKSAPLPAAKSSCTTSCNRVRAECSSGCGAEPSDASRYDAWQTCASKCVAAESRCRLGCR